MNRTRSYLLVVIGLACSAFLAAASGRAAQTTQPSESPFPKPSLYPVAWELKFEHKMPKRIVIDVPGAGPQAYWYMTYGVTNNTEKERLFLPFFEMLTRTGKVVRSDNAIPAKVFDAIKARENNRYLLPAAKIAGELRIGEDQAKEGVAIWPEPDPRMGTFSIFVGGLSGESVMLKDDKGEPTKDPNGQPVILRKTLEITYQVPGDERYPGEDPVNSKGEQWIMR
jgi:hypothetical protein